MLNENLAFAETFIDAFADEKATDGLTVPAPETRTVPKNNILPVELAEYDVIWVLLLETFEIFGNWLFAFLIATIPAYFGYNVKGGSLEVGRASTQAVVWTIVAVIITNLVLTQMFLS